MNDPQSMKNIGVALLKAQIEIQQTEVKKTGENDHFHNTYAELPTVIDAVIPVLNKHGVLVVQLPTSSEFPNVLALTTLLLHVESGESVSATAVTPLGKEDPQGYMAAITYLRRGSLISALGLKTVDDDGEGAVGRSKLTPTTASKTGEVKRPAFLNSGGKKAVVAAAPQRQKASIFPKVGGGKQNATQEQEEGGEGDDQQQDGN
jgi:hypothetical protein